MSEFEFDQLHLDEIRLMIMGHADSSYKAYLLKYLGLPGRGPDYSGYWLYKEWYKLENSPLGKAMK